MPEDLPLLDCLKLLYVYEENSSKLYALGEDIKNAYNKAVNARDVFLYSYNDLCFPPTSTEKEEWEKFFENAKTENFPKDLSIFAYEQIVEKYKSKIEYYEDLMTHKETYYSLRQEQIRNELGLPSGDDTGFYELDSGELVYGSTLDSKNNVYSVGKVDYYTEGNTIVPYFIVDNECTSSIGLSRRIKIRDAYDIEINAPSCSHRKSKISGRIQKLCNDIERIILVEMQIPYLLTEEGHKHAADKHAQEVLHKQKIADEQRKKEAKNEFMDYTLKPIICKVLAIPFGIAFGLFIAGLIGAIIGAAKYEVLAANPGFFNAVISVMTGNWYNYGNIDKLGIFFIYAIRAGGLIGGAVGGIAVAITYSIYDPLYTITKINCIQSSVFSSIMIGIIGFVIGGLIGDDKGAKIGAVVASFISSIIVSIFCNADDDALLKPIGISLISTIVSIIFITLAELSF